MSYTKGLSKKSSIEMGMWTSPKLCEELKKDKSSIRAPSCYPHWVINKDHKTNFHKTHLKYDASVYDPTIDLSTPDEVACDALNLYSPSNQWIQQQSKYINDLPSVLRKTIKDYTFFGDTILGEIF